MTRADRDVFMLYDFPREMKYVHVEISMQFINVPLFGVRSTCSEERLGIGL